MTLLRRTFILVLGAVWLIGCSSLAPEPTPTLTPEPTATATFTHTPTPEPTATHTPVPTPTPVPTATPIPAETLLSDGDQLMIVSDWEGAAAAYEIMIETYPEDGRGLARLAYLNSIFVDKRELALDQAQEAAETSPDSAYVLAILSMIQNTESMPDAAKATAEQAVALDDQDAWALIALAQAQLVVGEIDEALETMEAALDVSGDVETFGEDNLTMSSVYSSLNDDVQREVFALLAHGEYNEYFPVMISRSRVFSYDSNEENDAEQLDLLNEILASDPDYVPAILGKASYYRVEEDYENALEMCDQVVELHPELAVGYLCRGNTYEESEQFELALEAFDAAIDRDIDNSGGYFGRGVVFFLQDQLEEARVEFEKALELFPYSNFSHIFIGYTHLQQEETTAAIESFQQALDIYPYSATAKLSLGRAYAAEERYEEAEAEFLAALALDTEFAQLHIDLALTQFELGKSEEAEANFAKAIELEPDEAFPLVAYGDFLLDRNRYFEAQQQYQAALELEEESIQALIGLGYSYAFQDNCGAAITTLNQARDLDPDNFVANELYSQCLVVYRYDNPPGVQGEPINEPTAVTLAKNEITGQLGLGGDRVIVEFVSSGADRVMVIAFLTDFDPATQQNEINAQMQRAMIVATDAFVRTDTEPLLLAAEAYVLRDGGVVEAGSFIVHRTDSVDFWNGALSEGGYIGKFN